MKFGKSVLIVLMISVMLFVTSGVCIAQEEDAEGCKDSPLLSRLKGFTISSCESNYDQVEFRLDDGTKTLEGQKTKINYSLNENAAAPSEFQIRKNYANAVKSMGGSVVSQSEGSCTLQLVKNGKEIWIDVSIYNSGTVYSLTILELGEMAQEVTAGDMLAALDKDGFMALDIHFDTGQAVIKPESEPIVEQIAVLLRENPELKLSIEGHTDNIGDAKSNKVLSEQRAKAVAAAVAAKGIEMGRLTAVGWGQEKPVADNRSEEGRAKNRRVEIIKK